jgi:TetR/AcrR family transcriptional regulator, tetracycline repressor protein
VTGAHSSRRGPRRTLNEQVILDAALTMLAELGADRITIRGIATRVGIAPNAVYTYFPDKAAVLDGLAEQLLGRICDDRFTDPVLPWRDRVHAIAHALRTELLAHPGSARLLLGSTLDGPKARLVSATMLGILADAGLEPDAAAHAAHLLNVHTLGSVALASTGHAAADDQFRWGLDRLLDGLTAYVTSQRNGPESRPE